MDGRLYNSIIQTSMPRPSSQHLT